LQELGQISQSASAIAYTPVSRVQNCLTQHCAISILQAEFDAMHHSKPTWLLWSAWMQPSCNQVLHIVHLARLSRYILPAIAADLAATVALYALLLQGGCCASHDSQPHPQDAAATAAAHSTCRQLQQFQQPCWPCRKWPTAQQQQQQQQQRSALQQPQQHQCSCWQHCWLA
jgi:hypothetical protein